MAKKRVALIPAAALMLKLVTYNLKTTYSHPAKSVSSLEDSALSNCAANAANQHPAHHAGSREYNFLKSGKNHNYKKRQLTANELLVIRISSSSGVLLYETKYIRTETTQ
jgi:hypothetical protein